MYKELSYTNLLLNVSLVLDCRSVVVVGASELQIGHIWPFGTLSSGSNMILISSEYATIHHLDAVTLIW